MIRWSIADRRRRNMKQATTLLRPLFLPRLSQSNICVAMELIKIAEEMGANLRSGRRRVSLGNNIRERIHYIIFPQR
jgi:hypothetical protein